jgi:alpha-tubulin suppressor-like RCC1 family protein
LVQALVEAGVHVDEVGCGEVHTLFFDKKKGQVWACGTAAYGRLGIGANWNDQDALVPQLLQECFEGERVVQVSAGFSHSLALTESGRVFSWGRNDLGQLGLGDSFTDMYSMEDMPRLVESTKMRGKVVHVSAGKGVSAALREDGKIFHWGHNVRETRLQLCEFVLICAQIMLEPTELSVPDSDELNKPVVVKVAGDSAKGGAVTVWITADGELHTAGSYKSHLRGKEGGGFFSSDASTRVVVGKEGENRKVLEVFTGFGQHMAVRATHPLEPSAY